jgi:putative phosphoesterase
VSAPLASAARVAALYDIHANLPALEAVIADVRRAGADAVVVGGDVVPGPMPRESMELLHGLDLPVAFIRGNGDREVLARMRGIETGTVPPAFRPVIGWTAAQLDADHESRLAAWPETLRVSIDGIGCVLFCHATPRNDTEIFTASTADERLAPVFAGVDAAVVVCGHTHMPFDRRVGGVRIVNAGSVGMPFGDPGAYWLLLGPGIDLRRTEYDLDAAAERIRHSPYPQAEAFASGNVLQPPSAAAMIESFGRVELR